MWNVSCFNKWLRNVLHDSLPTLAIGYAVCDSMNEQWRAVSSYFDIKASRNLSAPGVHQLSGRKWRGLPMKPEMWPRAGHQQRERTLIRYVWDINWCLECFCSAASRINLSEESPNLFNQGYVFLHLDKCMIMLISFTTLDGNLVAPWPAHMIQAWIGLYVCHQSFQKEKVEE